MKSKNVVAPEVACKELGISKSIFKICRDKNASGINTNRTVNLVKFKLWWNDHRDEIEEEYPETYEALKVEDKKRDIQIKDLKVKQMERELIEPEEVNSLMVEISTLISVILNRMKNELAPKCAGKSEPECQIEIDYALADVFKVLRGKIEEWK